MSGPGGNFVRRSHGSGRPVISDHMSDVRGESKRTGLWIVGAGGNVASTVALGLSAWRRGECRPVGLVSELPAFTRLRLMAPADFVLGGHETRVTSWIRTCEDMHARGGVFHPDLLLACRADLRRGYRNVRPSETREGVNREPAGLCAAATVERWTDDLLRFRRRHRLARVVVVNLASTEAVPRGATVLRTERQLDRALSRKGSCPLPASSLYALAAIDAGCAYVNFTPSLGIDVPAIRRRALDRALPYMGRDGKTGETLVKSALAPMFARRNLRVLSWVGYNLLGNRDGRSLSNQRVRASKQRTKALAVNAILGSRTFSHVGIDFVPSLDDWKTAWDFVHFEGFLGTKMSFQFCWQGCDSLLAAPLVIDLARFADLALRRGQSGPMTHLACFFKEPMDVREQAFDRQWAMLEAYAQSASTDEGRS